jgi:hypothetical protein
MSVTVRVPFVGDPRLFRYRPSNYDTAPPKGEICDQELRLTYQWPNDKPINLDEAIQKQMQSIQQYIDWVRVDIREFNHGLPALVEEEISLRREQFEQAIEALTGLGIPIGPADEVKSAGTKRPAAVP